MRPTLPATLSAAAVAAPRAFTARDLVMLARVTDPQLSPDGTRVLYDVGSTDFKADRGVHATRMLNLANP